MLSILYLNCWDLWGSLFPVRWSSPQDQPPLDLVSLTQPILKTAAAKKRILNVFNWHRAANIQSGFPKMNKIPRWVTIAKVQQLPMKRFKLHGIEAKRVFYLSLMDLKVLPEDLTMLPAFLAAFQFLAGPLSSENWEDDREEVRFLARLLPRALQVERWVCLLKVFRKTNLSFARILFPVCAGKPLGPSGAESESESDDSESLRKPPPETSSSSDWQVEEDSPWPFSRLESDFL